MPTRSFRDASGVVWHVWDTPLLGAGEKQLSEGWLTFNSGSARRRLAPIPSGWENVSSRRLEQMCRIAEPADRREVLMELVGAGQLLVTALPVSGRPTDPPSMTGVAAESPGYPVAPAAKDPAAVRAYQQPVLGSRANYRG